MAEVAPTGAERSLDDFFAKRDKKKRKEKCKGRESVSAPGSVGLRKDKKEKEKATKNESQDAQVEKEDEKWKDFEPKAVDYSGLRVQALQLSDEKEEEAYEKDELGEDGQVHVYRGERISGPWNKSSAAPVVAAPVEEVEVVEQKPGGVYRPPGARQTGPKRGTVQGPPEIFNDAQFPSLLSTAKHTETRKTCLKAKVDI
ncbi:protein CDV3 homolog isoform X1 [Paramormyrops kingsleyae]|uniref:protein CDV3 homolog isoform X1 n=2 Tax=Paramormyrops kingsleyae TaxID=1676925 RepID=UPI000CD5FE33|nr:protein CDV3 homolog isoform X1 [Paramormyrops kingsleyae]